MEMLLYCFGSEACGQAVAKSWLRISIVIINRQEETPCTLKPMVGMVKRAMY